MQGAEQQGGVSQGPWPRAAHLLQKLDLALQELVDVLRLLPPLRGLAPELGLIVAAGTPRVGTETTSVSRSAPVTEFST